MPARSIDRRSRAVLQGRGEGEPATEVKSLLGSGSGRLAMAIAPPHLRRCCSASASTDQADFRLSVINYSPMWLTS